METTLNNIRANNGRISISVYDPQNLEDYQIKGSAEYVSEGTVVDTFKAMVEKILCIMVERVMGMSSGLLYPKAIVACASASISKGLSFIAVPD